MKKSGILLLASTLCVAGVAFAQEVGQTATVAFISRYPIANRERPFTLPSQIAEMEFKLGHNKFTDFDASIWGHYGITDSFQFNLGYEGVTLANFKNLAAGQAFHLGMGYDLFGTKYAAAFLDVDLPLYLDRNVVKNVTLAMPTAFPIHSGLGIGLMTLQDSLIDFQFSPTLNASFNLPVRISWQVNQNFWWGIGTTLATLRVGKDDSGKALGQSYIWTTTPVYLQGLYAFNSEVDLIAKVGLKDAQDAAHSFHAMLGVAYRFGKMEG